MPASPNSPTTRPGHRGVISRRAVLTAGALSATGVVATGALTAPRVAVLGRPEGDETLAAALGPHLAGHRRVAAIHLPPGGAPARFAGFDVGPRHEFELGSVTKTMTGALLATAVERGELALDTKVADVVEAGGSAVADVTLAELASHTSGLPRLSVSESIYALLAGLLRKDPYLADPEGTVREALSARLSGRGHETYSNLGYALLGQLLATTSGVSYQRLCHDRLLAPLELNGSYTPVTPDGLRSSAQRGYTDSGLPSACWTMNGSAPAGGIRSTATDMGAYLRAMVEHSAPGSAAATTMLHEEGGRGTAMAWVHQRLPDGTEMIWKNGMTGGYAAFAGWLPDTTEGIVLLSDTARSVDRLAVGVLSGEVEL